MKLSRIEVHNKDFESPKFEQKNPLESGLTSIPNRGTQQGFGKFEPTVLEKCASAKPRKHDCFLTKLSRIEVHNKDFKNPKFDPKNPSGSGLTSAQNRGTQ